MSFVPEWSSHCIHKMKSTVLAEGVIALARPDTHGQLAPDLTRFAIFNLERISFLVYIIPEWNLVPGARISFGLKTGKWLVGEQKFTSVSCKQMERNSWRWNELVPEWKSFRYHVNSPLRGGTCMASRSMHILMSHFCDTQMGGICHIFVLSLQDALKFKLTIIRNSPYSSLDFEACLGFQNIEDAKIVCGDRCHPREKWSQHLSSNLTEVHKFIEEGDGEEEMCKAQRAMC